MYTDNNLNVYFFNTSSLLNRLGYFVSFLLFDNPLNTVNRYLRSAYTPDRWYNSPLDHLFLTKRNNTQRTAAIFSPNSTSFPNCRASNHDNLSKSNRFRHTILHRATERALTTSNSQRRYKNRQSNSTKIIQLKTSVIRTACNIYMYNLYYSIA